MPRIDAGTRLKAFDLLQELKRNNVSRKRTVDKVHSKLGIPIGTLYDWYRNKSFPWGRKGKILYKPELFYVLGALIGDGCVYKWKITNNHTILVGDYNFTTKYADMVTNCTDTKTKAYINRSKNIWFVKSNNFELCSLFKKSREDPNYLEKLIKQNGKRSSLFFIEGFFDAEGCVKIIKEKVRKTPKICLDMTNTNLGTLELIRKLLEEKLDIEARYSNQDSFMEKDGFRRKKIYHLRIYKKEFINKFFKKINTTKLKTEKVHYVERWLNKKGAK